MGQEREEELNSLWERCDREKRRVNWSVLGIGEGDGGEDGGVLEGREGKWWE